MEAQQYCFQAGILVAEGWLKQIIVQDQVKGFVRAFPKIVGKDNLLQFPLNVAANTVYHGGG
jgi:hypothetical protein